MNSARLVRRSLTHYWRTNVAVVLGVATAVAVLSGALLVGDSVRGSLADLVRQRLGATDMALVSPQFFREALAVDLASDQRFGDTFRAAAPVIVANAVVTDQQSGRRAGKVKVYGVDERFWRFHDVPPVALDTREAALSAALAREIGARRGDAVLVRIERPSEIPLESLHSRKDDLGRTLRLTTRAVLDAQSLGDFSLEASQGAVMAVFVPLTRLREELAVGDRINTMLMSQREGHEEADSTLREIVGDLIEPEDAGFTVRASDDGRAVIVGSSAGLVDDRQVAAIRKAAAGMPQTGVFTYLANTMRVGDRQVPYSLVTGTDLPSVGTPIDGPIGVEPSGPGLPRIVLNSWAAQELAASPGQRLSIDFYVWEEPGTLVTRSADFEVAGVVPIDATWRDLAPDYPGISNTESLSDWDPPFPLDLRRVRPVDEDYWKRYRATPKAFIPLAAAQKLWGSRYGSLTSLRLVPPDLSSPAAAVSQVTTALRHAIDPAAFGIVARDVRREGLRASQGATDFGEYFIYFSFFIVVSALVLVTLFFKLGIEQRVREVGLLRAVGLSPRAIRRLFVAEGALLAALGSLLDAAGAVAYASVLI